MLLPEPSYFETRSNEDGCSVYWSKWADELWKMYLHFGLLLSHDGTGNLKDQSNMRVWRIRWSDLVKVKLAVKDAEHKPINQVVPFPYGYPGNRSHAIINHTVKGRNLVLRGLIAGMVDAEEVVDVADRKAAFDGSPFV